MKRYLTMIRFFMEDSLRFLTEDMLHRYTCFIEQHLGAPYIEVKSINNVTCKWSNADFSMVTIFNVFYRIEVLKFKTKIKINYIIINVVRKIINFSI